MAIVWMCADAQRPVHVKWTAEVTEVSQSGGTIVLTATIDPGWHIFGMEATAALGEDAVAPQFTEIKFAPSPGVSFSGSPVPSVQAITDFDESLKLNLPMWEGSVSFTQQFKVDSSVTSATISGTVDYMACTQKSCTAPTQVPFSVEYKRPGATQALQPTSEMKEIVSADANSADADSAGAQVPADDRRSGTNKMTGTYIICLLLGFAGGLLAHGVTALIRRARHRPNND